MTVILLGTALFTVIVLALGLIVIAARRFLLPSREVSVVVNGELPLVGQTNQKLLNVLHDADIPVPSPCGGKGSCGLCRVQVTEGGGDLLATEASKLSRTDIANGLRLACQVTVRGDMQVGVSADLLDVEPIECTVASTRHLSPLIREIVLDVPQGADFDPRAGAFVQVTAPPYKLSYGDITVDETLRLAWDRLNLHNLVAESETAVTRAYSLANTPADGRRVVLFIRLAVPPLSAPSAPPGIVSSYLFGCKQGDKIMVSGPYGEFGATEGDREMVIIGGGVGMAPLRAIIHDQLERVGTKRKITFWYGARSRADLFYASAFDALAEKYENFSWTPALSDPAPEDDWQGARGFVHTIAYQNYLKNHPAPEDCQYFLCGPPLMIHAVKDMLDECGVDKEAIYADDFGA